MILTEAQQSEHEQVMLAICHGFKQKGLPMVLKGGTALKLCYNLDRFSEDLDFDCAKALKLETAINDIFAHLGKERVHLRHPKISITKNTSTVKRYRIIYADDISLKLETSMRGTPDDEDLIEINGILTYKVRHLIKQKFCALNGRTAARDLHDIVYLYANYFDHFSEDNLAEVKGLYETQSMILNRFNPAYEEDTILSTTDLLHDLMKLIELFEAR